MKFVLSCLTALQTANTNGTIVIPIEDISAMVTPDQDDISEVSITAGSRTLKAFAEHPENAVYGFARLKAQGWPTRKSPILTMEDLEWIGGCPQWPEPEALEEIETAGGNTLAYSEAELTLADVIAALGSNVAHEGPRLAAMRIRGERDEAIKESAELREMIRAVADASTRLIPQKPEFAEPATILNKLVERIREGERQIQAAYGIGGTAMREAAKQYMQACETANTLGKQGQGESLDEFIQRLANDLKAARDLIADIDTQAGVTLTPGIGLPARVAATHHDWEGAHTLLDEAGIPHEHLLTRIKTLIDKQRGQGIVLRHHEETANSHREFLSEFLKHLNPELTASTFSVNWGPGAGIWEVAMTRTEWGKDEKRPEGDA